MYGVVRSQAARGIWAAGTGV